MGDGGHSMPDAAPLNAILEAAIQAPSADNHHHVRIKQSGDVLRFEYAEEELPSQGGYKRVLLLLSLGAMAENLAVAASHFGLRAGQRLFPDPSAPNCLMEVEFAPGGAKGNPLWPMIPLRHTNRRVIFHGPKVREQERLELESAVEEGQGCNLAWLDAPGIKRRALRLMWRAEAERFRLPHLHAELFSAIRFDLGWQATADEGLPPGALGIEKPLRPFFALMRHWQVMRALNFLGFHYFLGWRASWLPARLAPHVGVISVQSLDDSSVCEAGRSFQRLWLVATRQGHVIQPLPASALYALEGARQEGIQEGILKSIKAGWNDLLRDAYPLMVFRMGNALPLPVASGRKPLAAYLY